MVAPTEKQGGRIGLAGLESFHGYVGLLARLALASVLSRYGCAKKAIVAVFS